MSYRSALPAVVLAAAAAVLLAVGHRVRVRRDLALIAGYGPRRVHDADGLARWVGGCVLALGGATLAAAPATYFVTDHYRGYPAVLVRLPTADAAELGPLLAEAWRQVAPKRVVRAWDTAGGAGPA